MFVLFVENILKDGLKQFLTFTFFLFSLLLSVLGLKFNHGVHLLQKSRAEVKAVLS